MEVQRDLPFRGHIIWLTPDQGGRLSGVPATPVGQDYLATGFVPPATVETGLASVVVRVADRAAWVSPMEAGWLLPRAGQQPQVVPGTVIVVTEGPRVVGYLHVQTVTAASGGDE